MSLLRPPRTTAASFLRRNFETGSRSLIASCLNWATLTSPLSRTVSMTNSNRRWFASGDLCGAVREGFTRRPADSWDLEELRTLPEHLRPVPGETLDLILRQKVYLLQSRRGYRANVDSHMLAHFASDMYRRVSHQLNPEGIRVLDLGAGNGLVSILFARAHKPSIVHLVELQPQLADRSRRNLQLNDVDGVVSQFDIQEGKLPAGLCDSFDVVLINPPFYPDGSRKAPRNKEKYLAHQETSASLSDFLTAANAACDSQNLDAFMAIIHDRRELPRLQKAISRNNLTIDESREMHHVEGEEPSRILLKVKPRRTQACQHLQRKPIGTASLCEVDIQGTGNEFQSYSFAPTLHPLILHPDICTQSVYTSEIETFLHQLPIPSLRIGRLRDS